MLAQPGEQIGGRYQIDSLIGRGGFSEVYRGVDLILGREVAIKLLGMKPFMQANMSASDVLQDMTSRFQNEARMVARLRDPSTVTLFDFGADERSHKLYMVLELIQGKTLRQVILERGKLDVYDAAHILKYALESLREAHAQGLLHRDIKPENLMTYRHIDGTVRVKIVDFGIAKPLREKASAMTAAGIMAGTPRYVPPERMLQKAMSPAGDLYSLGAVMHFALTGEEIYAETTSTYDIVQMQCGPTSITLPEELDLPDALRAILDRMLQKDAAARYQVAQQALDDLELLIVELQIARYDLSIDDIKAASSRTQIIEPVGLGLDESSAATMLMDASELPDSPSAKTVPVEAPSLTPSIAAQKTIQSALPSEARAPHHTPMLEPRASLPAPSGTSPEARPEREQDPSSTTSQPSLSTGQRNILIVLAIFVLLLFIILAILGLIFILKRF